MLIRHIYYEFLRLSITSPLLFVFIIGVIVLLALFLIFLIITQIKISKINKQVRTSIYSGKFIYYKDFIDNWITHKIGRKGVAGYKYNDQPGCYVILIFDHIVNDGNFYNYDDIYIGQSLKVCDRIRQHFTGQGKADIYADIKYGKHVYVQFITCPSAEMNILEKKLIRAFNATTSYNMTRGGGIIR